MSLSRRFRTLVVSLSLLNFVAPVQQLAAADARRPAERVVDVVLGEGGRLAGQLLNEAGKPVVNSPIVVARRGKLVAHTKTNVRGRFAVTGLKGGVYTIGGDQAALSCRCWAPRVAPPSARNEVLLVDDGTIQRGQHPLQSLLCNPIVIGLIVAAAIAIPIIVHNSDDDGS